MNVIRLVFLLFLLTISLPASAANISFGVINERPEKPDHAFQQYEKLHQYLSNKLREQGVQLGPLVIASDVRDMAKLITAGKVDILLEGVMPTLSIQKMTKDLQPDLIAWRKGQRQYHTVFFARYDSNINRLEDLEGKTIAFETRRSTSAYFIPRFELLANNFTLQSAEDTKPGTRKVFYMFANSETNQAYWVHQGKADAGAFNDGDWERVPEIIKKDMHVIHATKPVLRWLLSYSYRVDKKIKNKVNDILLSAHQNDIGEDALETASRIAKFENLTPLDLENINYWSQLFDRFE